MNIELYTLCYNEIKIMPFVIQYWNNIKNAVDDFHAYVYDNGSNDGSVEYLKQYDWITVEHFNSDGFNDAVNRNIKNNVWKTSRERNVDFVIVCDFDECLYYPDIKYYFKCLKEKDDTVIQPIWCEAFTTTFPKVTGELLHKHQDVVFAINNDNPNNDSKSIVFNPNKIKEINYSVGAHTCCPTGDVHKDSTGFLIHLKHLSKDYVDDRYGEYSKRLSQINKKMHWGFQYDLSKAENDAWFDDKIKNAIPFKNIEEIYIRKL